MHKLPDLSYDYSALEPYIDEQTMKIHHGKHHQAYVDNLNKALEAHENLKAKTAEELIKNLNKIPEAVKTAVRNNGGGHVNHSFFWLILKKDAPFTGHIADAIKATFGSFDKFKEEFTKAAMGRFGSGWAWLVVSNGKLEIMSTANQDNPISEGKMPVLGIDVWEHAYYLKYQNRRADYVAAFFNVINWKKVNEHYTAAQK